MALAYAAQGLLEKWFHVPVTNEQLPLAGGAALLAGGLLFGLAMPRPAEEADAPHPPRGVHHLRPLLGVAIAAYLGSVVLYALDGETPVVLIAWAVAIVCLLAAGWSDPVRAPSRFVAENASDWLLPLALILPVALVFRLWHLETLPAALVGDTALHGTQARELLHGPDHHIIGFGWTDIPRIGFLPEALSLAVFGDDFFGLCMSAVVGGMASLVGTYLLAAELYGPRVGWLAAGLLAVSYTHIHFSRVPANIDPVPWVAFSLYYMVRGVRTGRSWDAALAGLTGGLAFQMYFSGRIVPILGALLVLYLLVRHRLRLSVWVMVAFGFLVALGPMLLVFARHWDQFVSRARAVSPVLNPEMMGHLQWSYGHVAPFQVFVESAKRSFLTFSYYGNTWGERNLGRPFFDAFTAPLLALGFGYTLLRPRHMANWLLVSGFVVTVLLSAVLTSDPPFWQRLIVVMPITATMAALALDRIVRLFPLPKTMHTIGLLAILAGVGCSNWAYFVGHESQRVTAVSLASRYAATVRPGRALVAVRLPWQGEFDYFVAFLAPHIKKITAPAEDVTAGRWPDSPAAPVVILTADHLSLVPVVEASWPGGVFREFKLPNGATAFYAYEATDDEAGMCLLEGDACRFSPSR